MTHRVQDNQFQDVCEMLNQHGFEWDCCVNYGVSEYS